MNTIYPIAHMSYYAGESAKLLIVNFIENIKSTFPIFHLLRVKGIGIGHGVELLAQKKHPDQFNLIPNELSDEFDGVPVAIANQGYSYHLWGDINDEVQT